MHCKGKVYLQPPSQRTVSYSLSQKGAVLRTLLQELRGYFGNVRGNNCQQISSLSSYSTASTHFLCSLRKRRLQGWDKGREKELNPKLPNIPHMLREKLVHSSKHRLATKPERKLLVLGFAHKEQGLRVGVDLLPMASPGWRTHFFVVVLHQPFLCWQEKLPLLELSASLPKLPEASFTAACTADRKVSEKGGTRAGLFS